MAKKSNPLSIFEEWYAEVQKTAEVEPMSMVLSTVNEGRPTSRVVFLRNTIDGVYYFFTNYNSNKSKALIAHPYAALNFHWRLPQHRQVRITGKVIKASSEISDAYFNTRPRGSQIGAWSSPQSQEIQDRQMLEERVAMYEKSFEGRDIPRPEFWGGFGIVPDSFEFWQAGEFRLHERRFFTKVEKSWQESLLAP